MTDEQITQLARFNLFRRGMGAERYRPQVLEAEHVQAYYRARLGAPVSLDETFRVIARHNAMPNVVPIFTRAMLVQYRPFTPPPFWYSGEIIFDATTGKNHRR